MDVIAYLQLTRFIRFAKNAGHTDGAVKRQTLAEVLEYLWQGYPIAK
jgi:hypothetical protein